MTNNNQEQIEKDNNEIIESVMETLECALLTKPDENGKYRFITKDENGEHVEYKSREVYLQFMIEIAIEELQEHNYFFVKEGLDKYEGGNVMTNLKLVEANNDRKVVQVYEDELDQLIEIKNEYRYEAEKWEHILHGFIGSSKLENVFFDWIDKQQEYIDSGQDDEFHITHELYGDLDELRQHFSYLLEEPTLLAKTMYEAKNKKNAELLFQLLEQFRQYKIAKTDEQREQADDMFHGNYTELYQRFNQQKISQ